MDTLIDDCQFLIIKLLDLKEQFSLFEATKTAKTHRWNSNIRQTWENNKSYSLKWHHFKNFESNPELMRDFLSIISPTVHRLDLHFWEIIKSMSFYKFPKMRSLSLRMQRDCEPDNDLTPILQRMSSSLQNLEELAIFDFDVKEEYLKVPMVLPKLRKLTIEYLDKEVFEYMIGMRAKDIIKLTASDELLTDIRVIRQLYNLRQLTLGYYCIFESETVESAIETLPSLERLDIYFEDDYLDYEQFLLNCIAKNASVKILNLWNFPLEMEFYVRIRRPLKIALNARSSPLSLYFDGIDGEIDKREMRSYYKDSNLQVSFQPLAIDFNAVIFHLDPINKD